MTTTLCSRKHAGNEKPVFAAVTFPRSRSVPAIINCNLAGQKSELTLL